ncbi:MAG: DCC1-like thiol-disulfide oxidoreductase family protein [Bacteroidales bacterium]|jgi:predicted DCC family thiol-disulfide oxidoreductase YuxK|nr:DCC1-like thiol-disulfide oxidoreductase family protein [Bacteroidales bacterium]HOL97677.1 DCC1-like thiol-disulfide oxidoreductase family protein [Bacteroidales bacterium]HOM37249.1 DCC1-like thiol-disulfide oxidoreductase family protein [Bacteroidales bacterium]HPD24810.1 DCC1-like thiol-disulfide oxidoreductase family protein [Bacteroidales bacterium]HRT00345.1 DCC1-like thiol-disulfide oxidoreductase family protein [Bacteroidales bacterium]
MEKYIIFYDGFCPLCNMFVRWVLKYDKNNRFLVTSIKSDYSNKYFKNIIPDVDSVIVYDGTKFILFSEAIFFILKNLPLPLKIFTILKIIPSSVRDSFYRIIARNRNKISLKNYCVIPDSNMKQKILF